MADTTTLEHGHFVVSQELLQLFKWLVEHEEEGLKRIIARVYAQAMNRSSAEERKEEELTGPASQESIVDFFMLIEVLFQEVVEEHCHRELRRRAVLPALNHIDAQECDAHTLDTSATRAASIAHEDPSQTLEETFYRELLKHWKPKSNRVQ